MSSGMLKRYEPYVAAGVLAAGFLVWFIRDVRKKRN